MSDSLISDRPQFPVGVNVFVIQDGKLLLGKRKSSYHDGEWGLPGGHLEMREKILDAAARELEEETGLSAEGFTFAIAENDVRQDNFHYIHFGFVAEGISGTLETKEPDKCYGWEYFSLDNLPTPLFIGHKKLIDGFIQKKVFFE